MGFAKEDMIELKQMVTLPSDQLLQNARQLQVSISDDLRERYSKAFDSNYHPGLFHNSYRFHYIKKPIANTLETYREFELITFPQIAYFLNQYKSFMTMNEKNDPPKAWDAIFGKSLGGVLGEIMKSHFKDYQTIKEEFEETLSKRGLIIELKLAWYRNELAMLEEIKFAEWLSGKFTLFEIKDCPDQGYHLQKVAALKEQLTWKNAEADLSELSLISNSSLDERQAILKNKITELKCEKVYIDFTKTLSWPEMKEKDRAETIKYVLGRMILFGFIDNLINIEKQFFWQWSLHAKFSKLNSTWTMSASSNHPINKSQIYFKHHDHHSLLKLDEFKRSLATLQFEAYDEESIDKILKLYISSLHDYHSLSASDLWKTLIKFEDCEWKSYFKNEIETKLKRPLRLMNALVDKMEADTSYVPISDEKIFYDLYLSLRINMYQVDCLENEVEQRPMSMLKR